jgi:hypothetical protein
MKTRFNISKEELIQFLDENLSTKEIASKYGCSQSLLELKYKEFDLIPPKRKNLVGKKWQYFEVIEKIGSRGESGKQSIYWKCLCRCGNIKELSTKDIKSENRISCGCIYQELDYRQKHGNWRGFQEIPGKYWSQLKRGAKNRNIEFNISIEDIWNKFIQQDRKCALSNIELVFPTSLRLSNGTASLDRKDSTIGYTVDNIQWIHKDINFMKQEYNQEYFVEICKKIAENN